MSKEWNICLQDFAKVARKLKDQYKETGEILTYYERLNTNSTVSRMKALASIIRYLSNEKDKLVKEANRLDIDMVNQEKMRLSENESDDLEYQNVLDQITFVNSKKNYFERQIEKISVCTKHFSENQNI